MSDERQLVFAPFALDTTGDCLWRGGNRIALRPKTFAVLSYLVEHANRFLTKAELIDAVWPDTQVEDSILKVSIWEIRHALEDAAAAPKFLAAVGRKGYRFIAPVSVQLPRGGNLLSTPIWLVDPQSCCNSAAGSKLLVTVVK